VERKLNPCRIAVVGATGAVGRVFLRILEERSFPASEIRVCASERSVGKRLSVNGQELVVEEATPKLLSEVDFAFISASGAVSLELAPVAKAQGALVIDDSSAFRMDPDVPLVVPEVNADDLDGYRGIVSIPNCSTTPLVMVLEPLMKVAGVRRVVVDTYQSVSGTGSAAVEELHAQSAHVLALRQAQGERALRQAQGERDSVKPKVYPHQIAFNALPQVETFLENGYTTEEMKMLHETRKILHAPELMVSATCVRVPVALSHSEAIHIEFDHSISPGEVRETLSDFPGVAVLDDPESSVYPMPVQAEGKDEVFVGRIRRDISHPNGIAMWVVSDNLRKGAALNALQIAEEVLSRELLVAPRGRAQS